MDKRTIDIILRARDEASGVLNKVGKEVSDLGGHAKKFLGDAVRGGAMVGAVGLAALAGGVGMAIANINEAQTATAQLESVLKSTKGAAGLTKDAILEQATALSKLTTFSDEAILSGQNLLLTFTNIKGPVMQEATQTMLDMSQALGQDVKSSAIQLGKALNDPIQGITALSRVGVSFTDQQKQQIETLVASGRTMDAQRLILKELNTEFGGSATAAAATFGGQLTILKNQMGEVLETVGGTIVQALMPFAQWALRAVEAIDWQGVVDGTIGALRRAKDSIIEFLQPVIDFVDKHSQFFIDAMKKAALAGLGLAVIGVVIAAITSPIAPFIAAALLIGVVIQGLVSLFQAFKPQLMAVWDGVSPAVMSIWESIQGLWVAISTQLWPALQNLWNTISPILLPALGVLAVVIGVVIYGAIKVVIEVLGVLITVLSWLLNAFSFVVNGIKAGFGLIVDGIRYLKNNFWETVGFIIGFFATLPIKLPFLVFQAIMGIINWLRSVNWGNVFMSIVNAFGGIMGRVKDIFMDAFNFLRRIDWGGALTGIAKSFANALIGVIEGALKGALKGLPGGIENKINLPRFAGGGVFGGGYAITGEQGKEIALYPPGTRIVRNSVTDQVMGQMGSGRPIEVHVHYEGRGQFTEDDAVNMGQLIKNVLKAQGVSDIGLAR